MGVSEFAHDLNMKWRASMAKRNVHGIVAVIGFRSNFMDLLKKLIYNSQEYLAQKNLNEYKQSLPQLRQYLLRDYVATGVTKDVITSIKNDFITDLESISKIKGIMWSASKKLDLTHGVIFFYLSSKSLQDFKKCIADCEVVIQKVKSARGVAEDKPLLDMITGFFSGGMSDEDLVFLKHFSLTDLKAIQEKLDSELTYYERNHGKLIGAAKITDGIDEFEDSDNKYKTWVRLDPELKKIQMFDNPVPHSELTEINVAEDEGETKSFGIFSGQPISLADPVATQLLNKIQQNNTLDQWLDGTAFGTTNFEDFKITPNNWHEIHHKYRVFDIVNSVSDEEPVNEQQVRSYFLNYAIDALSDSQKHTDRFVEVRTPKKPYDQSPAVEYRADYFVRISNILVPLEAKKDIGDGESVLSQIQRYANIGSFFVRTYNAHDGKFSRNKEDIKKPHGVVLIGDKNGIYLAYSDANLEGKFVYRNGYQLFWPCSDVYRNKDDIRKCVIDLYNLHDKFYAGQITNYDKYELKFEDGNQYKRIQAYLVANPPKQKGWFGW